MAWTTPVTYVANTPLSAATLNAQLRDNSLYLLNRPHAAIKRDNGANYTTTSGEFVPIDATNLSITLNISGSAVAVAFAGVQMYDVAGSIVDGAAYDILIDPAGANVRYAAGGADGLTAAQGAGASSYSIPINFTVIITGLAPGARTFRPVWKRLGSGTAGLRSGNGVAGQDFLVSFAAWEVA